MRTLCVLLAFLLASSSHQIVKASGWIKVGKKLAASEPAYPSFIRQARIEGDVVLEIVVGTMGDVTQVRVTRSDHLLLDDLAVEAVKKWKYEPTLASGVPVAVLRYVTVEFRLVLVPPHKFSR